MRQHQLFSTKTTIFVDMKNLLFVLLSLLLLSACGEGKHNSQLLERADAIMNDSCEVALSILQDSIDTSALTTERGRAIYAVLLSQALDKNYIDLTSDSIIAPALEYFADGDDPHYAMLTHYYYGKILLNQNKLSDAIIACTKAENFAKELNDDFYLGLIYGTIADGYHRTHNAIEGIRYSQLSYSHFSKINKQPHKKYALYSLAIFYNNNGDFNEGQSVYRELIDSATTYRDTSFLVDILESYSHLFWANQKHPEAKQILKSIENNYKHQLSATSLAHLAAIYSEEEKHDSASHYLSMAKSNIADSQDSIAVTSAEYIILYNNKDYKSAIDHILSQIERVNSASKEVWDQSVMTLQRDYLAQELELSQYKQNRYYYAIILISALTLLIITLIITYSRQRIYKKQQLIDNYAETILELRDSINSNASSHSAIINELFEGRFSIINDIGNAIADLSDSTADQKLLYKEVKEIISRFENPKTLTELEEIINRYKNNLMQKFRDDFPSLSNDEYQQACYHYAGFSPKFISLLMHQKYPTIYKRRTRIKEKIMASDSAHKEELIANLN